MSEQLRSRTGYKSFVSKGLKSGSNNLKIIMMCELPTNSILAHKFINYFDGFSIGSNDMTQLTLGLDRDSGIVSEQFDERDESVKYLLELAINACKKSEIYWYLWTRTFRSS